MPDPLSAKSDTDRIGQQRPGNLPVPVQQGEVLRPSSELWLMRALRALFGWKAGSARADLQVVLDATAPDETSFTTVERTMLRNILDLHERRIADVMVHRADIVAVKRDIPLGELMSLFESAAHSRLVVYNETLDDPEGMVHIRDLLAFMTAKARVTEAVKTRRKKPFPAGLDLRTVDPVDDAYLAQEALRGLWEPIWGPVAGLKIATTTKVMQALMGIDHPCGGMIYGRRIHASPYRLRLGDYQHCVIECELVRLRLGECAI